nr:MAG TPA: hypothetical protein [Caudoviricetes sp.]
MLEPEDYKEEVIQQIKNPFWLDNVLYAKKRAETGIEIPFGSTLYKLAERKVLTGQMFN